MALLVVGISLFLGSVPAPEPHAPEIAAPFVDPTAAGNAITRTEELMPIAPAEDNHKQSLADPTKSTVAWPLKVQLQLIEAAGLPHTAGVAAMGSGATAHFSGSITGGLGEGLVGAVKFIAGPNVGRELRTNAAGKFGATDLYPGLSVVELGGLGGFYVRREVRLRGGAETPLHVGFGMPGAASGRVLDRAGEPIPGATVELDGQMQFTDLEGAFLLPSVPSGLDLECIVSKPGYASHFELVTIAARQTNDRLMFTLGPGGDLDIEIPERIGGPEPAQVIFMNASSGSQRRYPWRLMSPLSVATGSSVRVEGLPTDLRIRVYVFHSGAYAKPTYAEVTLQEGVPQAAIIHLEPAPLLVGTVRTRDGLVSQGAKVRLEAPDRVGSTVAYFGETSMFLESEVLPTFPMGLQETVSDHNGRFGFTSFPKQAPRRYLVATSADGTMTGTRIVGPEDTSVDVTIAPSGGGVSQLRLDLPGRHQAIEVDCAVQGAPRDRYLLPANEEYVIDGLAPGMWRMTATWHGQEVQTSAQGAGVRGFKIERETTQTIRLPQGAIDGQDADTLLRAGRKP